MYKRLISLILAFAISISGSIAFGTAYDKDGLKQEIYNHLIQLDTEFTLVYKGSTVGIDSMLKTAIAEAVAHDDYLYYVYLNSSANFTYSTQDAEIRLKVTYRTTAEKEAQVQSEVERILKMLKLETLSDYYRVQKIIDYMSETYTYDDSLTKHTAYDLITTNSAVCQGYGELFYLLAKGAGIPVRNQEGTLDGGPHLWNLVKIGGEWYHVDVTNQHLFKKEPYVIMGSDQMRSLPYRWDKLVEYTASNTGSLQTKFNSNTYDPNVILEKLSSVPMTYEPSEDAKQEAAKQEAFESKITALEKYFTDSPEKKSVKVYDQALATLNALKVMDKDAQLVYKYEEKFYNLEVSNATAMATYTNGVLKNANTALGKTFTEKGYTTALKILTDGRNKVSQQTFDQTNRKYFTAALDKNLKLTVTRLLTYYKQQYVKTGKDTYKKKYTDLVTRYAAQLK